MYFYVKYINCTKNTMGQEITSKNTKAQIMDAYENLLTKVKDAKKEVPKQMQEERLRIETVEKVAKVSSGSITNEISVLKNKVDSSLEDLQKKLTNEFNKLEDIRKAIHIETKNLEDLYTLTATTDSLAVMILSQKKQKEDFEFEIKTKKDAFEQEISDLRELWKVEKEKQINEEKEYQAEKKKNRLREEDEYQYKLKIDRQKDKDIYESKKLKLETELSDKKADFEQETEKREASIKEAEQELAELRKTNKEFPVKLEKALTDKEKSIIEQQTVKFAFENKLLANQNEGELKLKIQTISSLKEKISEMQQMIKELSEKVNKAENTVKDIAVKAIDSSSKIQVFPTKENEEK